MAATLRSHRPWRTSSDRRAGCHAPWLEAAFLFFLVGYGTKMGLAPMHTWLPDAHSESPSLVSALFSGALLNCAFLGILRAHQICVAAGLARFSQGLLLAFGLLSMAVAAVFILGQSDFKRMLAYSSVEHMGILALGVGLGGAGAFGTALHAVNHSLTKACLFLVAGNILAAYETKSVARRPRACAALPLSGVALVRGLPGDQRLAALWPLPQRVDDPQGGARPRPRPRGRWLPGSPGRDLHRYGQRCSADGPGPAAAARVPARGREALWATLPPAAWRRWSWCSASTSPRP